jgi:hypothetical protein
VIANPWALAAVAVAGALQLLAVAYPPLARVLGVVTPAWTDLPVVLGLALLPALAGQLAKGLRRP